MQIQKTARLNSQLSRVIVSLLVIIATCACGVTRDEWSYLRDVRSADRLADEREFNAAYLQYLSLAPAATADVDLRYLRFRTALMLEKMERYDEAIVAYRAIWTTPSSVYDDYPARALMRTAGIVQDVYDDRVEAESMYWGVVRAFPDSNSADDALFRLRKFYSDNPAGFIDRIKEIYPDLINTEIADNLLWETAIRLDEEFDDCAAAMDVYHVLAVRFHRSGFVDNAIWNTGACLRRLDRVDDEYELLVDFVGSRELSILIGDYNYRFYHPAYMRLAEIQEERGNLREALDWYDKFQDIFVFALDWDDVQLTIVKHLLALGEREEAEKRLEELKKEWPESFKIERIKNLIAFDQDVE